MTKYLLVLITLATCFSALAEEPETIVASATELDIEVFEIEYDIATVTISGPNGYHSELQLDTTDAELDFDKLGMLPDGHYKYQIQYTQNTGVELVSDRKTGRNKSVRNLGKVQKKSGYFNVKDNEFVTGSEESERLLPNITEIEQ
ncbi:hypothetical protein [Shewanella donghaensis]|uniref:hypothetical protein n=1 Tax=Shewanella donghaensis TaxID=238836 RepID=UPI0011834B31|nr:hypothetical protein [Shewanella donghaensis]